MLKLLKSIDGDVTIHRIEDTNKEALVVMEERCGLGWMDLLDQAAHLKPQIRKDITITKYKMVKQEQGSLVFNLQVPEVPPSGQQTAPEQGEVAPSAPQHPANPDTQPVPSAQHLVTNVINLNL